MKLLFENWRKFLNEAAAYVADENTAYSILNMAKKVKVDPGDPEATRRAAAKSAYYELATRFHPDKHPEKEKNQWAAKFAAANEAFKAALKPETFRYAVDRKAIEDIFPQLSTGQRSSTGQRTGTTGAGGGSGIGVKHMFERKGERNVYESIKNIFFLLTDAIENKKSINVAHAHMSADIAITNKDFSNLKDFFEQFKFKDIRESPAVNLGRTVIQDLLKRLVVMQEVSFHPKYEKDLQQLDVFKTVLGRVLSDEDKTE